MGYRVTVDNESASFIRKLRHEPREFFGKRYSGYVLFLIGGGDVEIFDWLKKNILTLDSLTGEDVAYCVFSQPYKIHFTEEHNNEKQGNKGDIKALLLRDLNSKGFGGKVKDIEVINEKEAIAITYGTDIVARMLNVVDQLPCLVILDAIPKKEQLVLPLKNVRAEKILPLFRESIHKFANNPGYKDYKYALVRLDELQKTLANKDDPRCGTLAKKGKMAKMLVADFDKVVTGEKSIKEFEQSQVYKFKEWNAVIEEPLVLRAIGIAHKNLEQLKVMKNTSQRLSFFATNFSWKLNDEERIRYENICRKFVFPYIGESAIDFDSRDDCVYLISEMQKHQDRLVNEMTGILPNQEELIGVLDNSYKDAIRHLSSELYRAGQPSLMAEFRGEAKTLGLESKSIQFNEVLKTYAQSWLKPEVLIEIGKLIFGVR